MFEKSISVHITSGVEGNMNTRVDGVRNINRVHSYYPKAVKIELLILP